MILIASFLVSGLLAFGLMIFLIRPSADETAVQRRVVALRTSQADFVAPDDDDVNRYLKTLQRGSFGWAEDIVDGSFIQQRIQTLVLQADQATAVGTVLISCVAAALFLGGMAYLFSSNPFIALGVAGVGAFSPVGILMYRRKRRIDAFNEALPDCVDMMARALRAGHSLVAAIDIVADQAVEPAKTEFGEVFKKQNYGLPLREAFMQLLDRVPSQDLKVLITGVLVQKDTGGNLAEILDRILFVIKERVRLKGEIKTHTAQGRLTGWILSLLPIVMLGLINVVNPGYSSLLFTDPLGKKLLYGGIGLLSLGVFFIRRIVKGIEV